METQNTPSGTAGRSGFNLQTFFWIALTWMLLMFAYRQFVPLQQPQTLSYSQFKERVSQGRVTSITMQGSEITGRLEPESNQEGEGRDTGAAKQAATWFHTILPPVADADLMPLLEKHKVVIQAKKDERPWLATLLISLLPWLLLIGFFFYSSKKLQERMGAGGRGGILGFGKSKARRYDKAISDVTFNHVAGLVNAKSELQEAVAFLKDPGKFEFLGGQLPKGVLLIGPPGVGKTLLARATAGEAGVPFFSISGSEFIEMFVGVGASRVRDIFKQAKKKAPTIIFIDELDSIGRARGTGLGGGHDEREQTLNQILSEMDGFAPHESVMVLAATNRPDVLDPALVRPGRFDRQITIELPQKKARREILAVHTRNIETAGDVDLDALAAMTVGLSGADLRNLVNEAALLAAGKNKDAVDNDDLKQARDKILMGLKRDDVLEDREKRVIAYHEAGHAVAAKLLPGADPVGKVTIIPRGRTLGATEQIPKENRYNLTKQYLLHRIVIMLAGREAEKLVFEDVSTGAADDLKQATQLARRMVTQWGMSAKLGAVSFRRGEPHPFLGKELTDQKDYSEDTARLIDSEIRKTTRDMEDKAAALLAENRDKLDALAELLIVHETVGADKIDKLF